MAEKTLSGALAIWLTEQRSGLLVADPRACGEAVAALRINLGCQLATVLVKKPDAYVDVLTATFEEVNKIAREVACRAIDAQSEPVIVQ